jgi:hypothetical protein
MMAARLGRKRKAGLRELNGRLLRPTVAQMAERERAVRMAETHLVLMQPHRRGDDRPECVTALGRFWLNLKTSDRTLLHAGESYAGLVRRFRAAWGMKEAVAPPEGLRTGEGPSDRTVRAWRAQIEAIEGKLSQASHQIRFTVNRLVLDDKDLTDKQAMLDAQLGLRIIAIELGMASGKDHPFK